MSKRDGCIDLVSIEDIPDSWRAYIRRNIECPCCFVTGAEIVRGGVSRSSARIVRQPYFRFVEPGHREHCDFAASDRANAIPENLVAFSNSKSNLTRAVRELVCTAISLGFVSQRLIRDMREWFFSKKVESSFEVTLDPRLPRWISELWRSASFLNATHLPKDIPLTPDIARIPGFDWRGEAIRVQHARYSEVLALIRQQRLWCSIEGAERVATLADRYHGQRCFDPSVLEDEYNTALALAEFISANYSPIKSATRTDRYRTVNVSVLAFSALLLFANKWELRRSIDAFASIARAVGDSNQLLGNVMGLNPFHDFEAWKLLKRLQTSKITLPQDADPRAELKDIEHKLRLRFGAAM